jgi:hypothetical protein
MDRRYFESVEWKDKVNPAFAQYWKARKRYGLVDPEDQTERGPALEEWNSASRLLADEQSKLKDPIYTTVWEEIARPLDGEVSPGRGDGPKGYAVNPESTVAFRQLTFLTLGITFRQLITLLEEDLSVYSKLLKVHRAYWLTRKGSFRDLRLKFHSDHFSIMVQGLDFGLRRLNEWELALCFDEICPCDQRHSAESLKKFRTGVTRACKRLRESMNEPTSFEMPTRNRHRRHPQVS